MSGRGEAEGGHPVSWNLSRLGDAALVVAFEERIDPAVNRRVVRTADALRGASGPGVRDVVGSFAAVTVHFDPLRTDVAALADRLEQAAAQAEAAEAEVGAAHDGPAPRDPPGRTVEIPVCYGGAFGPDLGVVARFAGCSEAEAAARHAAGDYRVYMLGFLPGFAYLGTVDPAIAAPRRDAPRLRVPAQSVGIAGGQTGVYPLEAPGGWQLIGRTPRPVYDPQRTDPFLLRPGDAVRFAPIPEDDFHAWRT